MGTYNRKRYILSAPRLLLAGLDCKFNIDFKINTHLNFHQQKL